MNMAAATMNAIICSDIQQQFLSSNSNVTFAKCILVKEQFHSPLLELRFAITIISLLRDDVKTANTPEATNIPKPSLSCEWNGYEQVGDKWVPVMHSFNQNRRKHLP